MFAVVRAVRGASVGVGIVGLVVAGAALPASAAPLPIDPLYPIGSAPPSATASGVTGLQVLEIDGQPNPFPATYVPLRDGSDYTMRFRAPDPATSAQLPTAATGTFSMNVSGTDSGPFGPGVLGTPSGPQFGSNPWQPPTGPVFTDSAVNFEGAGAVTYAFDFSTLDGGALPEGSVIALFDVDDCGPTANEQAVVSSSSTGDWLRYYSDTGTGVGSRASVTNNAGVYTSAANCNPDQELISQTFTTTTAVSAMIITLTGRDPATVPESALWWFLQLPVERATPAVTLTTLINDSSVTAAPGPDLTVGDPVTTTYRATNTGNTTLTNLTVTDDGVESADIDCGTGSNIVPVLAVGASATCHASEIVTEGDHRNTGTVTAIAVNTESAPFPNIPAVTAADRSWYRGTETPTTPPTTTPTAPPTAGGSGSGSSPSDPGGTLAFTGSDWPLIPAGAAAVVAIVVGLVLVLRRRRAPRP